MHDNHRGGNNLHKVEDRISIDYITQYSANTELSIYSIGQEIAALLNTLLSLGIASELGIKSKLIPG